MTSPTMSGALAEEAARADDRDARIRAEGFRAGAEAMRKVAAAEACGYCAIYMPLTADGLHHENRTEGAYERVPGFKQFVACKASRIRSLSIPKDKANG